MIVFDIEASGINPKKHSIVSIGAIDLNNPANTFYMECRIWDGAHILLDVGDSGLRPTPEVNGFSVESMQDSSKKSVGEIVLAFKEWVLGCEDQVLAGHNPYFDLDFLTNSIDRFDIDWSLPRRIVDLHSVCYCHMLSHDIQPPLKHKKSFLSSDDVMKYAGLPEEPKPHNALNGALWEAEALHRLIYSKPLLEQFKKYEINNYR